MTRETFTLPNGRSVQMETRPGTNDHNVAYSIITEDEYQLDRVKPLSGTALDVGAHIGAATVALLELNPDLHVVAIEPVPENIELLRANTAPYAERVTILEGGAGTGPQTVRYGFSGNETATVHRFIANQRMDEGTPYTEITVPGHSLSELVERFGPIAFIKIDCEGCEDSFLDDPAIEQVERLSGEFHNGPKVEIRHEKPERVYGDEKALKRAGYAPDGVKRDPGEKPRRKRATKRGAK